MLVELKIAEGQYKDQQWFVNPNYVADVFPSAEGMAWVGVVTEGEAPGVAVNCKMRHGRWL